MPFVEIDTERLREWTQDLAIKVSKTKPQEEVEGFYWYPLMTVKTKSQSGFYHFDATFEWVMKPL